MTGEILCVGTELLLGDIINTNAAYLAGELAKMGIFIYHQSVVGDNGGRLKKAVESAFLNADLLVLTGGLGPTYDDLTKETIADYFGLTLQQDAGVLEKIEDYFQKTGRVMAENNKKQAMVPVGATVFQNDFGTAPGIGIEQNGKVAVLLPGPPNEMKPMFERYVMPFLKKYTGTTLVSHSLHLMGIGESAVENRLKGMMQAFQNPTIAPYAKEGEVRLRITASAPSKEEAEKLIAPVIEKINGEFAPYIYGVDVSCIEEVVVKELEKANKTVAFAESCTGGLLSKRVTDIPGASTVFHCGVCAYDNAIKQSVLGVSGQTLARYGAVSRQTAAEMAKGIRRISGADIGISLTGIAGPGGGTAEKPVGLVYLGIDSPGFEDVQKLYLGREREDDRAYIRMSAANQAFLAILKTLRQN